MKTLLTFLIFSAAVATAAPPPAVNTQPPTGNTQPPAVNSPPPVGNTPPPVGNTPPPAGATPPPAGATPPPAGATPPPVPNTPPPGAPANAVPPANGINQNIQPGMNQNRSQLPRSSQVHPYNGNNIVPGAPGVFPAGPNNRNDYNGFNGNIPPHGNSRYLRNGLQRRYPQDNGNGNYPNNGSYPTNSTAGSGTGPSGTAQQGAVQPGARQGR